MFTFFQFLSFSPRSSCCSSYCCCCRQQFVVCAFVCLVSFRSPCHFPSVHSFFYASHSLSFVRSFRSSHFDCNILSIYEGKDISLLDMPMSSVAVRRSHPPHSLYYYLLSLHPHQSHYDTVVCACVHVCSITIANDAFTCKIVAAHLPMLQLLCCFR